jgi:hypothetical protein
MSIDQGNHDAQLTRIQRLVNAARLEMQSPQRTDQELRRLIRCEVNDLLKKTVPALGARSA